MEAVFRGGEFSDFSGQIPALEGEKLPEVAEIIP
jgi:hypothetical protein